MSDRLSQVVDRMMAGEVNREELSDPILGLSLQSEHLKIACEMNNASKKSLRDDSDSNAAKADEEPPQEGSTLVNTRPRGRPKGSRNKSSAPPPSGIAETPETPKSHVFEIPSGVDVRMELETFAHRTRLGILILSGSGTVTNVTLLQPAARGGTVTYDSQLSARRSNKNDSHSGKWARPNMQVKS